jgi:hypothetical protein
MTFAIASTAGTGTVTIAANTAIVTGTGTTFAAGDVGKLLIVGSQWAYIKTFVSTTSIVLDAVFATAVTGAAFSLANANAAITQTGTDANLTGLASIPGVYRTQNALATTHTEYRTQHPFVQAASASLTINAQTEQLQYTGTTWPGFQGPATATWINTGYYTANGVQFASENYAFVGVRQGNDALNVHILHAGRVEILGCAIYADSRLDFRGASAVLKLRDAVIDGGTKSGAKRVLIDQGVTIDAINYRIYNIYFDYGGGGGVIVTNDVGGQYLAGTAYAFYNENNSGQTVTKRDFESVGCANDYSVYSTGGVLRTAMINAVKGTVFKAVNSFGTGFVHNIDFSKEVAFTAATQAGTALQDVQVFARDYNDGRRHNANGTNWIPDRTYVWSTDATGAAAFQRIYTGEAYGTFNTLLTNFSYRSKNLNNTDIFGFFVKKYGYFLTSFDLSMKNAGVLTQPIALVQNPAITLSRPAALALTTLATVDDLLDRSHAWGTDPTIAILEYPTSTTMIVEDSGKVANAGARSIVIDSAVASVFAVNTGTNVITVKSTSLAKGVKFDTIQAAAITVAASTTVSADLIGPVTNAGTFSGTITGNVVNTGTINGANITGNVTQATPTNLTGVTIIGNYTFNTNTPITVTFTNSSVSGTVSNSGTGLVTITLASGSTIGTVGSNVVTQRFANVTAPNIIVGSRVQLYDTTNNVELFNGVLSGALNYQHTYVGDITVRLRATYQSGLTAKLPVEATGLLTATGLSFLNSQTDDGVYIGNLINGSTVTEYTPDYPNVQIDVTASSTVQRLYSWTVYNQTTADGIRYLFAAISAIDAVNYLIDQAILDVKLDNTGATPVVISGGVITRKDGTTVIAATSGSIQIDPAKAYVANSAEISLDLQTIKNYTAASV